MPSPVITDDGGLMALEHLCHSQAHVDSPTSFPLRSICASILRAICHSKRGETLLNRTALVVTTVMRSNLVLARQPSCDSQSSTTTSSRN